MSHFINCGVPLPGFDLEVRGKDGMPLPERHCGTLFVRGPSVMAGYFEDATATRDVLSEDGWLNTGDLGYRVGESLIVTGREKDLIIINGRNIWPQDLEYLAEQQPEVRTGDASAFSVSSPSGDERAVLVIECRESDPDSRLALADRLRSLVNQDLGIDCFVELVPRNTLPRTTSGKLSRSGARADFLKRTSGRQVMFVQAESGRRTVRERRPFRRSPVVEFDCFGDLAVQMTRVVALTGATGFIGSVVARRLRSAGWTVRALIRTKAKQGLPALWRLRLGGRRPD